MPLPAEGATFNPQNPPVQTLGEVLPLRLDNNDLGGPMISVQGSFLGTPVKLAKVLMQLLLFYNLRAIPESDSSICKDMPML